MEKRVKRQRFVIRCLIVGAAVAVAAWLSLAGPIIRPAELPPEMPPAAPQRCIGLFLVCVSLWFTNLIPPAATGLLAIALLPALHILDERQAFGLFGNSALFFMLGVFLLAGAMIATGLSKRVTLIALQRFDRSPDRLVIGVTVSASFLALWMPEHAVAAMIYPILVEIVDSLNLKQGSNYAKRLFLGLAWGSVIGGVGTFLGGARVPLALSMLQDEHPGTRISFLWWMAAAMPIVILMTAVVVVVLRHRLTGDVQDIRAATVMLDGRVKRLGPLSAAERRLAGLALFTIAGWITLGHTVGLAVIAILAAVLLFALRIVDWRAVQAYVDWGVLVMYGGAIALGHALSETQAMTWLVGQVLDPTAPKFLVIMFMIAAAMVLTEGISNSAAVATLLPIGYSLGMTVGIDPVTVTLAVTIPAGLTFLLPVGSPPNAISFSAGHYSIRQAVQLGWPISLSAFGVIVIVVIGWWGAVLGMSIW